VPSRRTRRHPAALIAAAVVSALAVAGCSGDSTSTSTAQPSTTAAVATTTRPATTTTTTTAAPVAPVAPESTGPGGVATYRYGPDPAHLLDLLPPADLATTPGALHPAIVFLHSGGFISGSRVNIVDAVTAQQTRGWFVVAADFRLAPDHVFPEPNQDVDRVIRWTRLHGRQLGIDPDKLIVLGTSAGGALSLAAGADPGRFVGPDLPPELARVEPRLAGAVSVAGPSLLAAMYDQPVGWGHATVAAHLGCGDTCTRAQLAAASAQSMVRPTPPPGLFIFGEVDTLVPADIHGYPLKALWEKAGGSATVMVGKGYGHNLALGAGIDAAAFAAWLDRAVGR
jgi:acetyl esterase/lipase